jgi:hypothetical protein
MDDRPSRKPPRAEIDDASLAAAAGDEAVVDHVEGLGATLVLTATRAIVVRQGAHFRPRTGVRAWPLGSLRDVQLTPPRNGNGRLVLRTGPYPWQSVNLFVSAQEWPAAERVVGEIRVSLARIRRLSEAGELSDPTAGPARPEQPRNDDGSTGN